jgi:hypothetical protein
MIYDAHTAEGDRQQIMQLDSGVVRNFKAT